VIWVLVVACTTAPIAPVIGPSASRPAPTAAVASPERSATPPSVVPGRWPTQPTGRTEEATLAHVVDGDTIRADIGGIEHPIRYIGIDTPEVARPDSPVEAFGPEASEANRRLVRDGELVLERDVSEVDRFDRLLRYIWIRHPSGEYTFVNLELILGGWAHAVTYPPDVKYADVFIEAEREARDAGRGLWGAP
jgi:micrococcal nuclease